MDPSQFFLFFQFIFYHQTTSHRKKFHYTHAYDPLFFFLLQARLVVVITFSFSHTQFLWLSFSCQRFASSQKLRFSMLQVTEIHRFSDTQNNDCSDLHTDERPKMSKKIFTLQHWVFPCELFSRALCDVTTQSRAEEKTVYFPFPKPVFHH